MNDDKNECLALAILNNRSAFTPGSAAYAVNGSAYSYGTCIATSRNGRVIVNATKYSATTSRRLKGLLRALSSMNVDHSQAVDGLPRGCTPGDLVEAFDKQAADHIKDIKILIDEL